MAYTVFCLRCKCMKRRGGGEKEILLKSALSGHFANIIHPHLYFSFCCPCFLPSSKAVLLNKIILCTGKIYQSHQQKHTAVWRFKNTALWFPAEGGRKSFREIANLLCSLYGAWHMCFGSRNQLQFALYCSFSVPPSRGEGSLPSYLLWEYFHEVYCKGLNPVPLRSMICYNDYFPLGYLVHRMLSAEISPPA